MGMTHFISDYSDVETLLHLTNDHFMPSLETCMAMTIEKFQSAGGKTIAVSGGSHIGAVAMGYMNGLDAFISVVVTHPNCRKKGLASIAVSRFIEAAYQNGCGRVLLNVNAANANAIRLYHSLGFRDTTNIPRHTIPGHRFIEMAITIPRYANDLR